MTNMNFEDSTKHPSTLTELGANIVDEKVLDRVLNVILEQFCRAIHAEAGTLWYFDKAKTQKIYPRCVYGKSKLENVKLDYGTGIVGSVIKENNSLIVSDCSKDERWNSNVDIKTGFSTKSMICVPLDLNKSNYPFGAIQIINKTDDTLFENKDLDYAEKLADECAKLLAQKLDKSTVEVLSKKRVYLGLDSLINDCDINDINKKLTFALSQNGYDKTTTKEIVSHIIKVKELLNK